MAPLGQYDPTKLINLGSNRWAFKPEIGLSRAWRRWRADLHASVWLTTDNTEFLVSSTRSQDQLVALQTHFVRTFAGGVWVSFGGTFFRGGQTQVDGLRRNDLQSNSRLGASLTVPFGAHAVKAIVTSGLTTRIGGIGFLVQLVMLGALVEWVRLDYLVATALATETAVLHNFVWHECWTWRDRTAADGAGLWGRLLRFNAASGSVSVVGNVVFTGLFASLLGMHYVAANLLAITTCSVLNFLATDRSAFVARHRGSASRSPTWPGPAAAQKKHRMPAEAEWARLRRWWHTRALLKTHIGRPGRFGPSRRPDVASCAAAPATVQCRARRCDRRCSRGSP